MYCVKRIQDLVQYWSIGSILYVACPSWICRKLSSCWTTMKGWTNQILGDNSQEFVDDFVVHCYCFGTKNWLSSCFAKLNVNPQKQVLLFPDKRSLFLKIFLVKFTSIGTFCKVFQHTVCERFSTTTTSFIILETIQFCDSFRNSIKVSNVKCQV